MELEAEILTASKESAAEGKDASVLFPSNLKDQARAPQTNDTTVLSCGVLLLSISSRVDGLVSRLEGLTSAAAAASAGGSESSAVTASLLSRIDNLQVFVKDVSSDAGQPLYRRLVRYSNLWSKAIFDSKLGYVSETRASSACSALR
eukprot:1266323-Rhodomonas_salina.1